MSRRSRGAFPRTGRRRGALLLVAALGAGLGAPLGAQSLPEAREALRTGAYEDARDAYRRLLRDDPASAEARVGLMRTLATVGEYGEARELGEAAPRPVEVANTLGEVLLRTGDIDGAEAAFRRSVEGRARDALVAEANLAELLYRRGEVEEAFRRFDRFFDVYNAADGRLPARDLVAVGRAMAYLGILDSVLYEDALRAFDEAARADPGWVEPVVRAGRVFLTHYLGADADTEFRRALERNPRDPDALVGLAMALDFSHSPAAMPTVVDALAVNPNHVGARALLARLFLTGEDQERAIEEAQRALEVNPASLEALSVLAAAYFFDERDADFRRTRERALTLNPRYAGLDATVAETAVRIRLYADAVERARAGTRLDSLSWESWGLLGMNELRMGEIEAGREHLERAFNGDPANPWFKNSLDLLDTFERFETRETEHFRLFLHGTEADLLGPLAEEIAEEAYDSLARRYGAEPPLPIRVEMYPRSADFSVRTLGEAGLGALGVSFGPVLVMDSPAARERGEYNWASVLWHELAHSFHLALSENHVPRWFSEGLAVHEQRKAREGWGHQVDFPFLAALRDGHLKDVGDLNDGFMRPDFPEQVVFSYYQASLVFQVIEDGYGFAAIREMLDAYRRGLDTDSVFVSVLGTSVDDFDEELDDYMRGRFARPLAGIARSETLPPGDPGALLEHVRLNPGDLVSRLRLGATLVETGRLDEAEEHLEHALREFPEYGGPDSPYWYLARIHEQRGDLARAVAALSRLNALSESNLAALEKEAELLEELGRDEEATEVLFRAAVVYPYEVDTQLRLAELAGRVGNHEAAVAARRAVVALDPPDRADALFRLALALRDAGDGPEARRTVLRALEIAPNYEAALELVLELRGREGTER